MNHRYLHCCLFSLALAGVGFSTSANADDGNGGENGGQTGESACCGLDVKGGFFNKDVATKGLIDGADMGGRPKRDLSQGVQQHKNKAQLRHQYRNRLRNSLNTGFNPDEMQGGGQILGSGTTTPPHSKRKDNAAIVPGVDGGVTSEPQYSTGTENSNTVNSNGSGDPTTGTQANQDQVNQDPAVAENQGSNELPIEGDAGAPEENLSEQGAEVTDRIKNVQRALAPGGLPVGAPGTATYTKGVLNQLNKQVDGQSDWKSRATENRLSTEGNKF